MAAPKDRKAAEKKLKQQGFSEVKGRGKGSHQVWQDKNGKTVTVPTHGKEIAAGTWRSIEKVADAAAAAAKAQAEAAEAQRLAGGQAAPGSGRGSGGQGQRGGQQGNQQSNQQGSKKKRFFGR
ncbi:type II toxin-antitoxin system HicA family toxin [Kribbella sp. NPDC048928]|uniref:type II toxin-antitoxin system HicA family toxin n=1 Tax=Kribbella sp. NPDC048928 TaxID=3364111 RepID=UPI00371DE789